MIRLYDPTAEPRAIAAHLAPRLTSLQGKRIGILDNGKANAGTLMLAVAKTLQERYGAGEIVKRPWGELSFYVEDPWGNGLCFVDETTLFTGK